MSDNDNKILVDGFLQNIDWSRPGAIKSQLHALYACNKWTGTVYQRASWQGKIVTWLFDAPATKIDEIFAKALVALCERTPDFLDSLPFNHAEMLYQTFLKDQHVCDLDASLVAKPEADHLKELHTKNAEQSKKAKLEKNNRMRELSLLRELKDPVQEVPSDAAFEGLFDWEKNNVLSDALNYVQRYLHSHSQKARSGWSDRLDSLNKAVALDGSIRASVFAVPLAEREKVLNEWGEKLSQDILGSDVKKGNKTLLLFNYGPRITTDSALLTALQHLQPETLQSLPKPLRDLIQSGHWNDLPSLANSMIHQFFDEVNKYVLNSSEKMSQGAGLFYDPERALPANVSQMLPEIFKSYLEDFIKEGALVNIGKFCSNPLYQQALQWIGKNGYQLFVDKNREALATDLEKKLSDLVIPQIKVLQDSLEKTIFDKAHQIKDIIPPYVLKTMKMEHLFNSGPLWMELEKQDDGTVSLALYSSGASLEHHPVHLLKRKPYVVKRINKIKADKLKKFLCHSVKRQYEPLWNAAAIRDAEEFYTKDILSLDGKEISNNSEDPLSHQESPTGWHLGDMLFFNESKPLLPGFQMRWGAFLSYIQRNALGEHGTLKIKNLDQCRRLDKALNVLEQEWEELKRLSVYKENAERIQATIDEVRHVLAEYHEQNDWNPLLLFKEGAVHDVIKNRLHTFGITQNHIEALEGPLGLIFGDEAVEFVAFLKQNMKEYLVVPHGNNLDSFHMIGWILQIFQNIYLQISLKVISTLCVVGGLYWLGLPAGVIASPLLLFVLPKILPPPLQEWYQQLMGAIQKSLGKLLFNVVWNYFLQEEKRTEIKQLYEAWKAHALQIKSKLMEQDRVGFELSNPLPQDPQKDNPSITIDLKQKIQIKIEETRVESAGVVPQPSQPFELINFKVDKAVEIQELLPFLQQHQSLKGYSTQTFLHLINQISRLELPSQNRVSYWNTVDNPEAHLQLVSNMALELCECSKAVKSISEQHEHFGRFTIAMHSLLAIMDCLARRCPDAKLNGFRINAYPLLHWYETMGEQLSHPRDVQRMHALFAYLLPDIDLKKLPSKKELDAKLKSTLFHYEMEAGHLKRDKPYHCYDKIVLKLINEKKNLMDEESRYLSERLKELETREKLLKLGIPKDVEDKFLKAFLFSESLVFNPQSPLSFSYKILRLQTLLCGELVKTRSFFREGIKELVRPDKVRTREIPRNHYKWHASSKAPSFLKSFVNVIEDTVAKSGLKCDECWKFILRKTYRPEALKLAFSNHLPVNYHFESDTYSNVKPRHKPREQSKIMAKPHSYEKAVSGVSSLFEQKSTVKEVAPWLKNTENVKDHQLREMILCESTEEIVNLINYLKTNKSALSFEQIGDEKKVVYAHRGSEVIPAADIIIFRPGRLQKLLDEAPDAVTLLQEFFIDLLQHYQKRKNVLALFWTIAMGIQVCNYLEQWRPGSTKGFPDFRVFLDGMDQTLLGFTELRRYFYVLRLLSYQGDIQNNSPEELRKAIVTLFRAGEEGNKIDETNKNKSIPDSMRWFFDRLTCKMQVCQWEINPIIDRALENREFFHSVMKDILTAEGIAYSKLPDEWKKIGSLKYQCGSIIVNLATGSITGIQTLSDSLKLIQSAKVFQDVMTADDLKSLRRVHRSDKLIYGNDRIEIEVEYSPLDRSYTFDLFLLKDGKRIMRLLPMHDALATFIKERKGWDKVDSGYVFLEETHDDKIVHIHRWEPDANDPGKGQYIESIENVALKKGPKREEVPQESFVRSLAPLQYFCSTAKIKGYAYPGEKQLCAFDMTPFGLKFEIRKNSDGQVEAVTDSGEGQFIICDEQRHPSLRGFASYLLVKNESGKQSVFIPKNLWASSAAWRIASQTGPLAPLLTGLLSQMQSLPDTPLEGKHYYTYQVVEPCSGQPFPILHSDQPEAMVYLLTLYLLQANKEAAELTCQSLEWILASQPVSASFWKEIVPLALAYSDLSDMDYYRKRIMAAYAQNQLIQLKPKTKNEEDNAEIALKAKQEDFKRHALHYLILLGVSLLDLRNQINYPNPRRSLKPLQEYFLFQSVVLQIEHVMRHSNKKIDRMFLNSELPSPLKKLFKLLSKKEPSVDPYIDFVQTIGWDAALEYGCKIPGLAAKIRRIRKVAGIDDVNLTQKIVQWSLNTKEGLSDNLFNRPKQDDPDYSVLESVDTAVNVFLDQLFDMAFTSRELTDEEVNNEQKMDLFPIDPSMDENEKEIFDNCNASLKAYYEKKERLPKRVVVKDKPPLMSIFARLLSYRDTFAYYLEQEEKQILSAFTAEGELKISLAQIGEMVEKGTLGAIGEQVGLKDSCIPELQLALGRLDLKKARLSQLDRLKVHMDSLVKLSAQSESDDYLESLERFAIELKNRTEFSYAEMPARLSKLLLEWQRRNKTLLWKGQAENRFKVLYPSRPFVLSKELMGKGKTANGQVIGSAHEANGQKGVLLMYPKPVAGDHMAQTEKQLRQSHQRSTFVLNVQRNMPFGVKNLEALLISLYVSMLQGDPAQSTKEDAQSCKSLFIDRAHHFLQHPKRRTPEEKQCLILLHRILKLFRDKYKAMPDEGHDAFKFSDQLDFPLDQSESLDLDYCFVAEACMRVMTRDHEMGPIVLNDTLHDLDENYHAKVIQPRLAKAVSNYWRFNVKSDLQQQEFIDFLCDHQNLLKIPEWITSDKKIYSYISLAKGFLNTLTKMNLKKNVDVHFGVSKKNNGDYARPADGNSHPCEKRNIKTPYETLFKTYLTILKNGMNIRQCYLLILDLQKSALKEMKQSQISLEATQVFKKYGKIIPEKWLSGQVYFSENDPELKAVHAKLSKNEDGCLIYTRHHIREQIRYWPYNNQSNSQHFAGMFAELSTSSGSPYNLGTMPPQFHFLDDPAALGEALHLINQKCPSKGVHILDKQTPNDLLQELLTKFFAPKSTFSALTDGGYVLTGLENRVVALAMADYCKLQRPDIKAIKYFDEDENGKEKLYICEVATGVLKPADACQFKLRECLSYYDHRHGFGADITQWGDILETMGPFHPLFRILQECFRNRDIKLLKVFEEFLSRIARKKVEFAMTKKIQAKIMGQVNPSTIPTFHQIAAWGIRNEAALAREDNYPAMRAKYEAVPHQTIYDKVLAKPSEDFDAWMDLFKEFEGLFITKMKIDPAEYFGYLKHEINTEDALKLARDKAYGILASSNKLSQDEKNAIYKTLENLPNPVMPKKVTTWTKNREGSSEVDVLDDLNSQLTIEQNFEQSIQMMQTTEKEEELELKKDQQVFQRSDVTKFRYSEWAWPKISDPTSMYWMNFKDPIQKEGVINRLQNVLKDDETCPIFKVKDLLLVASGNHLKQVAPFFDKRLWMPNNFVPRWVRQVKETPIDIGSSYQFDLNKVLIHLQHNGDKVEIIAMGPLSLRDEAMWINLLSKDPDYWRDKATKVMIWDVKSQTVRAGYPADLAVWRKNKDLLTLVGQLKLLNGDVDFKEMMDEMVAWVKSADLEKVQMAFQAIHAQRSQVRISGSDIADIFMLASDNPIEEIM